MHRAPLITPTQARDTIDRLSCLAAPLRRHEGAPQATVAECNHAITAFAPGGKMPGVFIGKGRYVGDATRPGAFVEAGLVRRLIGRPIARFLAVTDVRQ